ncbi:hypothetical protein [Streptomyces sp. NPDC048603]|uniref:hypothetical protein n=1 Tax=Streptomyces sp. NPDC048603 TaxID=3365577 RepID=UPI0037216C39
MTTVDNNRPTTAELAAQRPAEPARRDPLLWLVLLLVLFGLGAGTALFGRHYPQWIEPVTLACVVLTLVGTAVRYVIRRR